MILANNHKNTAYKQFAGKQPVPKPRLILRRGEVQVFPLDFGKNGAIFLLSE